MMKRLISALLVFTILCSIVPITAYAVSSFEDAMHTRVLLEETDEETGCVVRVTTDKVSVAPGGEFTIYVEILNQSFNASYAYLYLEPDSMGWLNKGEYDSDKAVEIDDDYIGVTFDNSSSTEFSFVCHVSDNATTGKVGLCE
jgi:hypothetical protein